MFRGFGVLAVQQCLRCALKHARASCVTAAGSHVNQMVCMGHDIQVVFNDNERVSLGKQSVEGRQQLLHVVGMQACCWFIENK